MAEYRGSRIYDRRGKARDRRRRREWLLETFGDGTTAPCAHCGKELDNKTLTVDRIEPGGSYRRENIQPSCGPCNFARGNRTDWTPGDRATFNDEDEVPAF